MINRDVIIDELKEWDWNENTKKDSVRILCDELASEGDRKTQSEGSRAKAGTRRPKRIRNMCARLQECVIT